MMYEALAEMLSRPQPFISEGELGELREAVSHHVETKAEILEAVEGLMRSTTDPRVRLVLAAAWDDEMGHRELLSSIRDAIAAPKALTEERLWDIVWKDSPWHGAPGG